MKVTVQGFLLVTYVTVVIAQVTIGVTTAEIFKAYLITLPSIAVGTLGGLYCYGFLSEDWYRKILLMLIAFLGIVNAYKAI